MKRINWSCESCDWAYMFKARVGNIEMVQFMSHREFQELSYPMDAVALILGDMQKTMSEVGNYVE